MTKYLDDMISPIPIRMERLTVDASLLRIKGLSIIEFGHLPKRRLRLKSVANNHWAFTYIVRGSGTYRAGDGPVQRLEPGSVFWEWPGSSFGYGPEEGTDWDEFYVSFQGSRIQEWLNHGLLKPEKVFTVGVNQAWIRKIETIGDYAESGLPDNADRAALLLESLILDFCIANEDNQAGSKPGRKPEQVLQLLEGISNTLYQPWDEWQFLDSHHVSRSTLRRIVRQNTGYSLNEYVNRLKINEAKKLLRLTDLQVQSIARMLGFEDNTYFARLFKKYSGITAQAYRINSEEIRP